MLCQDSLRRPSLQGRTGQNTTIRSLRIGNSSLSVLSTWYSLFHTHTHAHALSIIHTHILYHTHTHSPTHTHTHTFSLPLPHSHTLSLSSHRSGPSSPLILCLAHSRGRELQTWQEPAPRLLVSLSHTDTHMGVHLYTRTQTHAHAHTMPYFLHSLSPSPSLSFSLSPTRDGRSDADTLVIPFCASAFPVSTLCLCGGRHHVRGLFPYRDTRYPIAVCSASVAGDFDGIFCVHRHDHPWAFVRCARPFILKGYFF